MLIGTIFKSATANPIDPPSSNGTVLDLARQLANTYSEREIPATTCGPLTINGQSLGPMELAVRAGSQFFTGGSPYIPTTVKFNNTRLSRGAGLTTAADSKLLTMSFWIKPNSIGTTHDVFVSADAGHAGMNFRITLTTTGRIYWRPRTAGGVDIFDVITDATMTVGQWYHVLLSVDMTDSAKRWVYINDVDDSPTWNIYVNSNLDFTDGDWIFGGPAAVGGVASDFDLADFYFLPGVYTDFSVTGNRRLFIDSSGRPVDLGATGTTPGIGSPLVYMSGGTYANWNTNDGTGGGFTVETGSLAAGSTLVEAVSLTNYFGNTADYFSSWVIINGDLTVDTGSVFTPPSRKLFTCVYISGNCIINGELSMTARGADHSATGSNITAAAIRIANGTYSSVTNPQVPATGGTGGDAIVITATGPIDSNGNIGIAGSAGGTGGGGSGGVRAASTGDARSGNGAPGSCFSGGPGGGGAHTSGATNVVAANGASSGGAGGDSIGSGTTIAGGGAGNPPGTDSEVGGASPDASPGTGGVLFLIVEGTLSGTGNVTAKGADANTQGVATAGGGASGGGSVTIMYGTDSSSFSLLGANGGLTSTGVRIGGKGGDGTARKLSLV